MFNSDRVEYLFNNRILTVDDVFIDCPINWLPSEIILKLKEKYKFIGEERINDINLKDRSIENGEYINYFYETNSKDRLIESGEYKYKNNEIKLKDKLVKRTLLEDELKNEDQNNKLNITNNKNITENFLNLLLTYLNKNLSYTWLINYKYHVYILVHSLTLENTERYFLDCSLYEYCDRMKLAQEYSLKNESIYGLVLKYKAFEIEEKVEKELKNLISDSGNKKFNDKLNNNKDNLNNKLNNNKDNLNNKFNNNKDYNLFDKILVNRNNIKKFLLQPVIKYLDIEFNKPEKCTCNIKKLKCVCTNSYTREHLKDILSDIKPKTKQEILTNFYNRKSINKFTYEEICLSKVVNHISEDELHLKMLDLGMEEPSPSYLYYVYNMFINTETEHGVGIKTGTGEINVSETIKEEDEISGDNCDGKEDGDGIDYSDMEGGDIGDEEDEEEKDIECGKDEKNEDENSIEDEISDEENSVDENDNENSVDEDDIGNYEDEDDNGNSVTEDDSENCIEESDNENFVDDGVDEKNNDLNEEDLHNDTLDNTNQNNIVDYTYKEGHLNNNQTCDEAVDYERRVFGTNMEEALCPGEGDEQVEGKDEQGKYSETQHTIKISTTEIFSEKLVLILRNILENNKLNKYKGDYKNGKKLNMKKLIPYIASDYKKDKIWMKRKKNDTKDYTVRLFIDNSKSMYTPILITELTKIYSKLKNSFLALNIPVEIYKFGTDLQKIENISNLTFEDVQTNINFVNDFTDGINIVLTDGIFQNTSFYNTSFLFILIDKNDIRKMSKVSVVNNEMVVSKYLDEFGGRYSVVKWCDELEDVFENCLSEMVRNK
ncbi:willebrand factor type a domain-containing aaa atpase [Vairimorpha apis BRL 01]|uniref:Willebrand factor type a domain-containing aaa atpase n=1 Tax=Vairimorpha apis BRL 01 TaxID=1037528 RepID=T0L5A7_9MICR|nr:willebrand factor type a domain-containing aaa atpase [Vairimorpha apis BRL 01]